MKNAPNEGAALPKKRAARSSAATPDASEVGAGGELPRHGGDPLTTKHGVALSEKSRHGAASSNWRDPALSGDGPAESSGLQLTRSSTLSRSAFAAGIFDDLPVAVLYFLGSTLVDANLEWAAISGLGSAESAGVEWLNAIHPDDRAGASECIATASSRPELDLSVRVVDGSGSANWFRGRLRCFDDTDEARLLTLTAVGVHRSNEARLLYMSSHDELTGLANRGQFVSSVTRTLDEGTDLAGMLFIDLDHFKVVNDHLGHRFGDDVLRAVCKRIESAIRGTDLASRLGGDEIGVFCPHVTATDELFSLADRIGEALATPFMIDAQIVIVGASIGVSFRSDACRTAEALIDSADRAMYVAKTAGGGRWATFDARETSTTPDVPLLGRPSLLVADDDPMLDAVRADIDRAEEYTMLAWQRSSGAHDLQRSASLVTIRGALRRARLLLRAPPEGHVATIVDEAVVDPRSDQLRSALDGGQAFAQAVGMIAQRIGVNATESNDLLRSYATASDLAVVTAAQMVVEREIDIDRLALVGQSNARDSVALSSAVRPAVQVDQSRRRPFHEIYREHSAAVYGSAAFIGGCDAGKVTEEAFVQFWQQQNLATSDPATERAQLLTIARRLALRTAVSTAGGRNRTASPDDSIDAVLRRSQAIDQTLACAHLSSMERSVAALVVYGRCSYAEVARILGESEDDLNRQLKTLLRQLRTAVAAPHDGAGSGDLAGVVEFESQQPVAASVQPLPSAQQRSRNA